MKTISVIKVGDEYHFKPFNNEHWQLAQVPVWLFDGYLDTRTKLRDIKDDIETYFND